MADLPYIEAAQEVKITGQAASTGATVNYVGADANGNMTVLDYADGPVTPGTVAAVSTLVGAQYNSTAPTLTNTQQAALQLTSNGALIVTDLADGSVNGGTPGTFSLLAGGIYNSTPLVLTNGQQASLQLNSSGYLLVAPPILVAPATQNITVQDTASTTTIVANGQNFITGTPTAGSAAAFVLNNEYAVIVQVTGTWTGTLQIEISMDGGTTWSPNSVTQDGTNYILNAFTGNFTGRANTVGYTNYRLRATTAITGTAVVKITEAVGPSTVYINNPIKLTDNAGDIATITAGGSLNVNITNIPSVTGTLTNNNAAPTSNNVGALVAIAESAINATRYTTGDQVLLVTDLAGNTNIDLQYYLGSAVSKTNPIATTISDGTNVITAAISAYGTAPTGTEVMGVNAYITNIPTVDQGTSPWITKDVADGSVTGGTAGTFSQLAGGIYNTTLPTLTNGEQASLQLDASGRLIAEVVGNVASGTADSGDPVKVGGVFNTTVPAFTAGQRGDIQIDSRGAQQVTQLDGSRQSYAASVLNLATATTATDIFTITGSATKTIRIIRIELSGTQNSPGAADFLLIKRSTANTGGTSTTLTNAPYDSTNAAATATVRAYTANPTALGTSVGMVRTTTLTIPGIGSGGSTGLQGFYIWDFGGRPSQAIVLRGTTQVFAINLNSTTLAGSAFDISIEWTEE
jgi:hypothetical protein